MIAALQKARPEIGRELLNILQSAQLPASDTLLIHLINEISARPDKTILVLDDYHLADNPALDQAIVFLLNHLPPQLHIIITTREDPPFPLSRYRARKQMMELRAADLRFTPAEAGDFFARAVGQPLTAEQITLLEQRTEGWVTGLQLAALSLDDQRDVDRFVAAFDGSHHFILDYLVEEVLLRQTAERRRFLLQTSILDSLNGQLCAEVTEQSDARAILSDLERSNMFIIPLDDKRQWYRYHHLFAEVLRSHLLDEFDQTAVDQLHRRASRWFAAADQLQTAIEHALAGNDFSNAADLIETMWPIWHRENFRNEPFLEWLEKIPVEEIEKRPVLSTGYGWELLNGAQFIEAAQWLRIAAEGVERAKTAPDTITAVSADELAAVAAELAAAQAYWELAMGNVEATIEQAEKALRLHAPDDHIRRGPPASLLGLAYWNRGELEKGFKALSEGMNHFRSGGNLTFALSGTYGLADIRLAQGRLNQALAIYQDSLQLAEANLTRPQGLTELHMGLAEIYFEQGNKREMRRELERCIELGEILALPNWTYRMARLRARFCMAEQNWAEALDWLDEEESLFVPSPAAAMAPIAAVRARVAIAQGDLDRAQNWASKLFCDTPFSLGAWVL